MQHKNEGLEDPKNAKDYQQAEEDWQEPDFRSVTPEQVARDFEEFSEEEADPMVDAIGIYNARYSLPLKVGIKMLIPNGDRISVANYIDKINNVLPFGQFKMLTGGEIHYCEKEVTDDPLTNQMVGEGIKNTLISMGLLYSGLVAICNWGKTAAEAFELSVKHLIDEKHRRRRLTH